MFLHCIVLHIQRWPQCNIRSEWLPHLGQEREKNFLISDKKRLNVRSPTSSPGGLIIAVQYPIWPRSLWTFQVTQSCSSFHCTAQCAVCKVRCHCIFYGPGIRYSDIFGAPGIRYSVIIKLPCALLLTGHLETVHAPVADTVAYFADLDAPVVDTVIYFGGNHGSRIWKSQKLKKVYFPRIRTSWDKYMFNRIVFFKF